MPNPFAVAGAVPDRQSKFAPLYVNRFWTGLFSNSNPLSEAAVPFLYQKFYAGSRFDTIRSGLNVEISPRLTLIRRPGNSVYNSQTFDPINTFYPFRVLNPQTLQTQIIVLADTDTAVYDATGPSTKKVLFTKSSGAGQTSFQSVGNTLYAGDGADLWKYLWFPAWTAHTSYTTGDCIIDPSGNIQKVTGIILQFSGSTAQTVRVGSSNDAQIAWINASMSQQQMIDLPGTPVIFSGFTSATFLNGNTATITAAFNSAHVYPPRATLTFPFTHAFYNPGGNDPGNVAVTVGTGTSGNSTPSWSSTIGGVTDDGNLVWTNSGSAQQDWGIYGPIAAPVVSNALSPTGVEWAASTYFWPTPIIIDSNGNIQLLTTDGTTSTVPTWATTPGVTTTDGSAVWTCQGSATRVINNPYNLGNYIAVTVTNTIKIADGFDANTHQTTYEYVTTTNYYFFSCTDPGTSSSTATGSISWPSTLGGSVNDGDVTWTNVGYQVTRLNSSTKTPTNNAKGNVANSQAVIQTTSIVDSAGSGGGSGFTQNVTVAGESGASPPTWATTGSPAVEQAGLHTTDSGVTWTNGGPNGSANTGTWVYGYSFKNSVSKEESSLSPLSTPILLQAGSVISVSGNGDPNWQTDGVDTINIYRSVQGFSTPFFLASIPAPATGGSWSYLDSSPDPPNPGSTLNEFIEGDTTGNNAPPPAGLTNLTYYLNRIFGNVGNIAYYSGTASQPVGVGAASWPGENFFEMPEAINQQWPSATGLLIFTVHGVYYSQSVDSNGNPSTPVRLLEDIGLLSPNLFTVNGSLPTMFTPDHQMLTLDPSSGVNRVSDPISDILATLSNTNSYLTWHANGTDSAYYLCDGSAGWYRLCPTASPESGYTWSPFAQIVGGVQCIKSVETAPGVKNLLLGPGTGGGKILKRDLTTNSDNGGTYIANATFGSFVLAQPAQCAEVSSITTVCKKVGSDCQVTILGDEISGLGEFLENPGHTDPPFLVPPSTVYSTRRYFSTLQQPAWMQNMQMGIYWPNENAANELLSFCIWGSVHTE